ncbi:ATP-dependent Clp protease ATP-binding subunit ClpC [Ktedonospora formicarum]|uniref:ATP-dependent Clp protease ATP-binding subunit ClpC n=1 Tax=Ktedonospora formicarum TaxID=2778364 RepID=A0A8J3MNT5_9CHLR|nr:ATP-dependent Clp protease ATP-binding subunit ClpC [Ktedonospora formicarum]
MGSAHLFLGLLKLNDSLVEALFASLHTSPYRVAQTLEFVLGYGNKALISTPGLNPSARATLRKAEEEAALENEEFVSLEHLLRAIFLEQDSTTMGVLNTMDISAEDAQQQLRHLTSKGYDNLQFAVRFQSCYDETPLLNEFSRDLTMEALMEELEPVVGREPQIERMLQVLARRSKNNPVLVGEPGVGKTALVEALAMRIIEGQVPDEFRECRVVALDIAALVAGTKLRGDFEQRLQGVMREVSAAKNVLLFIDELHTLVQSAGGEGSLDAANLFKPLLARGEFRCIGATTQEEYRRHIESDPALERRFQMIVVPEATIDETIACLRTLRPRYENFHEVTITDAALESAAQLSKRYIQERFLPDKAIDLVDEAAARARVRRTLPPRAIQVLRDQLLSTTREKDYTISQEDFPKALALLKREQQLRHDLWLAEQSWMTDITPYPVVDEEDIAHIVSSWTGIPVTRLSTSERRMLLSLENELHKRVVGQNEAVQAVARAVRRARSSMHDGRRPIGSFLFVGPTGVGKTELARALADIVFSDHNALLRFDMSEFMESHHVSRLIGTPAGYAGYEQAGQLVESVRRRPYSVVLFDEIEKAHPKIFDLLLQILEDGTLTDARGQTVSFKDTIIVLTSNAGVEQLTTGSMSFLPRQKNAEVLQHQEIERIRQRVLPALKNLLRPELLNRFDDIIIFHSLTKEHLRQIVDMFIQQTKERLDSRFNTLPVKLEVTSQARELLVQVGYDASYGARQIRRTIQTLLDDMLAEAILRGDIVEGDEVLIDADPETRSLVHVKAAAMPALATSASQKGHRTPTTIGAA